MFKLGITGGIGSGKSTVTDILAAKGITIVDSDVVARQVVEPNTICLKKIAEHFGSDILLTDGSLDRKQLRDVIFSQPNEKDWLEKLLHPAIREETLRQLDSASSAYTVLASPLLLEANQDALVDRIAVVDIPLAMQKERAALRDGSDEDQIQRIIDAQIRREDRIARADDIIDNSGNLQDTETQVLNLHKKYLELAKT